MKLNDRILRKSEVVRQTALSESTIDRLERTGQFPARRRIGPKVAVGWLESEILNWLKNCEVVNPPHMMSSPKKKTGRN